MTVVPDHLEGVDAQDPVEGVGGQRQLLGAGRKRDDPIRDAGRSRAPGAQRGIHSIPTIRMAYNVQCGGAKRLSAEMRVHSEGATLCQPPCLEVRRARLLKGYL